MNETERKLINRKIIQAVVNGFFIELTLDNGDIFEYEASDAGYSMYRIITQKENNHENENC